MTTTSLPLLCGHSYDDRDHRKTCDTCSQLWECCYPCLLAGFRAGYLWVCPDCRA